MDKIGSFSIPVVMIVIVAYGLIKKVSVFDVFLKGAAEGVKSTVSILPALVALVMAVEMLKSSGALDILTRAIAPLTNRIGIPAETIPLGLLRPVSGSGAMAVYRGISETHPVNSFVNRVASVMMGSSETTFYTIAVYFGAAGVKKLRHTVPAALCADFTAFFASAATVTLFFHKGG